MRFAWCLAIAGSLSLGGLPLANQPAAAAELRFNFRQPSFGGNPFLGDFLLQNAQLQNQHTASGGGGGGGGGGDAGLGGLGGDPFGSIAFPNPDDFDTGTTVIIGAPTQ